MKIKAILAIVAAPILLIIAIPTVICLTGGGFLYSDTFTSTSPDGLDILTISNRTAFPPSEFVDPSIVVRVKLSGKSYAERKVTLLEDSDLIKNPSVVWETDSVVVSSLSTRLDMQIELKRNSTEQGVAPYVAQGAPSGER